MLIESPILLAKSDGDSPFAQVTPSPSTNHSVITRRSALRSSVRLAGNFVRLRQERVVAPGLDFVQEPRIPAALERPTRDGKELFPLWIQAGRTGILCAQSTRLIGPVALGGRLTSGELDDGARERLRGQFTEVIAVRRLGDKAGPGCGERQPSDCCGPQHSSVLRHYFRFGRVGITVLKAVKRQGMSAILSPTGCVRHAGTQGPTHGVSL
jgi:hypothetical protein